MAKERYGFVGTLNSLFDDGNDDIGACDYLECQSIDGQLFDTMM